MLSKNDVVQRDQLEMIALDQLVPQNHWSVKWKKPWIFLSFMIWLKICIRKQAYLASILCDLNQTNFYSIYLRHPFHGPDYR